MLYSILSGFYDKSTTSSSVNNEFKEIRYLLLSNIFNAKVYTTHPGEPKSRVHFYDVNTSDSDSTTQNVRIQDFYSGAIIGPSDTGFSKIKKNTLPKDIGESNQTFFVPNTFMQWYVPNRGYMQLGWPTTKATQNLTFPSKTKLTGTNAWVFSQNFSRLKDGIEKKSTLYGSPFGVYAVQDSIKAVYDANGGVAQFGPPIGATKLVQSTSQWSCYGQGFEKVVITVCNTQSFTSKVSSGAASIYDRSTKRSKQVKVPK